MLMVPKLLDYVIALLPQAIQESARSEIPAITIATSRLALEVFDAESRQVSFAVAVSDPSFPLMGRVHHGLTDTLLYRLDPMMIRAMGQILYQSECGDFDPIRQLMFAVATQRSTPESSLCRFLLWEAMRMNLLIATWDTPIIEAAGCLHDVGVKAEKLLAEFLDKPMMLEDDVRPLNILVAAAAEGLEESIAQFREAVGRHSHTCEAILGIEGILATVRQLDARSAAVLWPGQFSGELGSQQIADRYPHHFPSANAVEAQRSRTLKKLESGAPPASGGVRLIDVLRNDGQLEGDE